MIISNKLNITYLIIMPDGETARAITESNTVNTEILSYSVPKIISSEKTTVLEGENVLHTVTVSNHSGAKLFDNFITIPQPNGAAYVEGSVTINGVTQPTYDPVKGFRLPDLNPGETIVIQFNLKANNPTITPVTCFATLNYTVNDSARGNVRYSENTDTLFLNVISNKINVVKSVDKTLAVKGEILHYTIKIKNAGNVTKKDIIFKDPIPVGTTFVSNSIKINGINYSVYNPAIGFALQSLAPGEDLTVEFDVKVN